MPMRNFGFFIAAMLFLVLINSTCAETKYGTLARILAKRTGATQFEEERYDTHTNCDEHKHHLKKRASDEDVDYEVYQGVVGRPGIDFPIFPRIPKTSFSCRTYGNGYFADMETDCQVFHICEEGRKISFLCPNGTIFQQNELTCDWWFKVNCLDSSAYYGESSEILGLQRAQRVRPKVPVQGFNIVGGGLNIKPKVAASQPRSRSSNGKSDRRIDSTEAVESLDFDDVSGEKKRKQPIANIENNSNDQETQITAESASFVGNGGGKRLNNYNEPDLPKAFEVQKPQQRPTVAARRSAQRSTPSESTERARSGHRGQQRYKDGGNGNESGKAGSAVTPADSYERSASASVEVSTEPKKLYEKKPIETEKPEIYQAHSSRTVEKVQSTTPPYSTYSTARRIESTRSTPYYTPTIPALSKSKSTEGKTNYIKGLGNNGLFAATTPNPNRFGSGLGSGIFLESTAAPKPTASSIDATIATFKPIIIGMRHHSDIPLNGEKKTPSKNSVFQDYLPTSTPATTGPTYLPKSAIAPNALPDAAGDDALLFAPNPVIDESITRNVHDMLKTVSLLKNKFDYVDDVVSKSSSSRAGLEIPPSSGPDALVSLAKYFAQEHNESSPNSLDSDASTKTKLPVKTPKPSDATVILTTSDAPPNISENADDIKKSLLSEKTKNQYTNLFGLKAVKAKELAESMQTKVNATTSNPIKDNFAIFPQIGSTGATLSALAAVPESRKIAKVFTNALSTYLDDPESFRATLASVRPTEPPAAYDIDVSTTTAAAESDFSNGTAKYYLPTKSLPDQTTTTQSIAAEINQNFEFTTSAPDYTSTTESHDGTTYRASLEFSAELAPPSPDSGEEFLQHEQTQSFVKSRNELIAHHQNQNQKPEKLTDATSKPTEHPWTLKSQTDFLDPLTINDGLMKEARTTTASPYTFITNPPTPSISTSTSTSKYTTTAATTVRTTKAQVFTQARSHGAQRGLTPDSSTHTWEDIFDAYDLPRDAFPWGNGLQRIANKLFGGLNEQEALHLKNVMEHAEHNRRVLSLLLLLIQTCEDTNTKELERSRKYLLNLLIEIDNKLQRQQQSGKLTDQTGSSLALDTTTTRLPVTTYRRGDEDYTSTTPAPTTTELPASATTTASGSFEETTKFEIHVEDPNEEFTSTTPASSLNADPISDRRALELLKSLYSLASKSSNRWN